MEEQTKPKIYTKVCNECGKLFHALKESQAEYQLEQHKFTHKKESSIVDTKERENKGVK